METNVEIRVMDDERARRIIEGFREPHRTEELQAYETDPNAWLQKYGFLPFGFHVYVADEFHLMRHHSSHATASAAERVAHALKRKGVKQKRPAPPKPPRGRYC